MPKAKGLFMFEGGELPKLPQVFTFTVFGKAKTAGSKKYLGLTKNNKPIMRDDSGDEGLAWRSSVQNAAREALASVVSLPTRYPIELSVDFYFARPKADLRTDGTLRPKAPKYHTKKPDRTKLLRSLEDALKSIVWHDDSQVFAGLVTKQYGETPRAEVKIVVHSVNL